MSGYQVTVKDLEVLQITHSIIKHPCFNAIAPRAIDFVVVQHIKNLSKHSGTGFGHLTSRDYIPNAAKGKAARAILQANQIKALINLFLSCNLSRKTGEAEGFHLFHSRSPQ